MYVFGPFRLDTHSRRLLRGEESIPITVRAFDTLAVLVEQAGRIVAKDDLMRRVWPDAVVEEANLSQQIFLLRKLLGEGAKDPRYIQTVPRRGYRFVATVTERPPADVAPLVSATRPPAKPRGPTLRTLRLSLTLPGVSLSLGASSPIALSPDGATLACIARDASGRSLYLRPMDRDELVRVPRSEEAESPFFSPDSRWVGFVARGRLWKALAAGGSPIAICEAASECRGACWTTRDEIVFAPTPASGLVVVSADGGAPRSATTLDFAAGDRTHRWPEALPDGRHVLFTIARAGSASFDDGRIVLAALDSDDTRMVVDRGSAARLVSSGHIVYMRGGSIMAAPFDAEQGTTTTSAIPVVDDVMTPPTGVGFFACSSDGCLVYLTGDSWDVKRRLAWVSAEGRVEPLPVHEQAIEEPRLSPDGRSVAFGVRAKANDVWVYDFAAATLTRVTFEGDNFAPIWSPDGNELTFSSNRDGPCHIFNVLAGRREARKLVGGDYDLVPGSWSPDGRILLFTEYSPTTGAGIRMCEPGGAAPRTFVQSGTNDFAPAIAPDGRLVAFTSQQSGQLEVYVAPLRESVATTQISVDGGSEPVWSRAGRLHYRRGSSILVAEIDTDAPRRIGAPRVIADGPFQPGSLTGLPNYDVALDGRLLVIEQSAAPAKPDRLQVVTNWFAEIERRLA